MVLLFVKIRVIFGGGLVGGIFQVVVNGIQVYKLIKVEKDFFVRVQILVGLVENLRKIDVGWQQMSVVYFGYVWLGCNGKMKNDFKKYENVLVVVWFYGVLVQLVVCKGLGIKSVKDLVGKKVGVGNVGFGVFVNCELFFIYMGVWDKIECNVMGYNDVVVVFGNKQLDVFWLFIVFLSGVVIMVVQINDIDLVNLDVDVEVFGFY